MALSSQLTMTMSAAQKYNATTCITQMHTNVLHQIHQQSATTH